MSQFALYCCSTLAHMAIWGTLFSPLLFLKIVTVLTVFWNASISMWENHYPWIWTLTLLKYSKISFPCFKIAYFNSTRMFPTMTRFAGKDLETVFESRFVINVQYIYPNLYCLTFLFIYAVYFRILYFFFF